MKESLDVVFCNLMRVGLGLSQSFSYALTEGEWLSIFKMAKQQTVLGVVYNAIARLPLELRPPRLLTIRLSGAVESIRGMNCQMNRAAARYTQLFEERGLRSVILKGQANARLYPDTLSRQAGDIDIWIPGGYDIVERQLLDMGLISEGRDSYRVSHHIGFRDESGIEIEVHHRPAELPFRNGEFQKTLLAEFENSVFTTEGFYAPSIRFALLMQLQHLYYHCIREGVGLRHYMDYFVLLSHSSSDDRQFAWGKAKRFGLGHACAAIMWVLGEVFGLSRDLMLCSPDRCRGKRLYRECIAGGNFGRGAPQKKGRHPLIRWFGKRMHVLRWLTFDPLNIILSEVQYWKNTISLIPERIKRRKAFL